MTFADKVILTDAFMFTVFINSFVPRPIQTQDDALNA